MSRRDLCIAVVSLFVGLAVGSVLGAVADAVAQEQQVLDEWEIQSGSFGQQSFYVVKHNRFSGETLILSAERGADNDKWLYLPIEDKR